MGTSAANGRPRDPEVYGRIMQAALDLFGDVGWSGFSIEAVARRAQVGKASIYLRWDSKEALLSDAHSLHLAGVADADTGTLDGDLVHLAKRSLDRFLGRNGKATMRLMLEADSIPGVGEHFREARLAQLLAARAMVRRGIARGELAAETSLDMLLDTVVGGAMMHALTVPPDKVDELRHSTAELARQLVDFVLGANTGRAPKPRTATRT
ncbi:TetR/AcrR family transcriptional regulator [Mycobacterium sp. MMS18-G62]